jgi:anti-sigma B factor antagonist
MTDDLVAVEFERHNGALLVRLTGEIDLSNVDQLQRRLNGIAAPDEHVILDLTGIDYIDSQGLRLLIQLYGRQTKGGSSLQLVAPLGGFAREVLEMTSINEEIEVLDAANGA